MEAFAQSAGPAAQQPNLLGTFALIPIFFLIFYFFLIMPQQDKEKKRKEMIERIWSWRLRWNLRKLFLLRTWLSIRQMKFWTRCPWKWDQYIILLFWLMEMASSSFRQMWSGIVIHLFRIRKVSRWKLETKLHILLILFAIYVVLSLVISCVYMIIFFTCSVKFFTPLGTVLISFNIGFYGFYKDMYSYLKRKVTKPRVR